MGMTDLPRRTAAIRAALAAAIALLAFAAALPATASAAVSREFWGVVPINELSSSEFDQMGAGNVGTMRQLVLWPAVEPGPGQFDWSDLDFVVANSAENNIRVLPFVYGTPNWVKGIDCHGLTDELCQRVPPVSPKASGQWKDFMRTIVGRYGAGGSFWTDTSDAYDPPYEPIIEWQIWNEPSSPTYYQPNPKVKGYAKLVKVSHDAITEVDPSAQIVLAGVFPEPEGGRRFRLEPYLSALYRVRGLPKHFDTAALHPYARTIKGLKSQIKRVRQIMRKAGVAKKKLWISEVGWGSDPPVPNRPLIKGEQGQKELLEESFDLLAAGSDSWNLAGVLWYSWRDPGYGYENCPFCSSSGLLKENGNPKPAWHSFVRITGGQPQAPPSQPPTDPDNPPPADPPPVIPPILP
jgi:polysaccharide biosynthesis protein PslG